MNLALKAVYYCATSNHRWGKGLTIDAAMNAAGITKGILPASSKVKQPDYYIQAAVLNNPSDEELDNLRKCITANPIDGSPQYYTDGRTDEDTEMITRCHVGWVVIYKTKGVQ